MSFLSPRLGIRKPLAFRRWMSNVRKRYSVTITRMCKVEYLLPAGEGQDEGV